METEVKRLSFTGGKVTEFEANGKKYKFCSQISIDRFIEFERLQAHVGFGKDFKGIHETLKDTYELLNKSKPADAAVKVHNLLNGIGYNLEKRDHPVLQMCALFLNREGENVKVYDEDLIAEKIADWREEGYSIEDFFQLAFNFVEGFIPILNEATQSISGEVVKATKNIGNKES